MLILFAFEDVVRGQAKPKNVASLRRCARFARPANAEVSAEEGRRDSAEEGRKDSAEEGRNAGEIQLRLANTNDFGRLG